MRPLTRTTAAAGMILALTVSTATGLVSTSSAAPSDEGFGARAEVHGEGGVVNFVGTKAGKPLAPPKGIRASSSPKTAARAFVEQHANEFGLGRRSEVKADRVHEQVTGNTTVRVVQEIDGVEVLGGELAVQLDEDNRIVSASGEVLPDASTPNVGRATVGQAVAVRSAKAYVARGAGVKPSQVTAVYEGLKVYDPSIIGSDKLPGARTVHAVEVSYSDHVRRQVFVDAQLGAIVDAFDEIHAAKNRRVCDAGNTPNGVPCSNSVLTEGGNVNAMNAEVRQAYTYSGATYDWFKAQFNRDSIDGKGMPLVSTVRYCDPDSGCPYANAFWNGSQMTYGAGYASADDVVGHELAHGVTERSSRLFYSYQSGAINESISDIFGEFVDLATSSPNDAAADRWKLGESLPIGAIRNMANPNQFNQPARMNDPLYYRGRGDNGGVHYNSGVGNKAASLMTDGGSFNGQTVSGLGVTKTAAIWYEANTGILTSASDYQDLARALRQACKNLVGTKGISYSNCTQVDKAVKATQMDIARSNAKDMKTCKKVKWSFSDGLEKGGKKWKAQRPWFAPGNPNNLGFDATYASTGKKNLWGFDRPGNWFPDSKKGKSKDYSVRTKKKVKVPKHKSSFLRFKHAYLFDTDNGKNYDGGRVEYSLNGKKWFDVFKGKYPNKVHKVSAKKSLNSKFAGKRAFAGESGGYRTTVVKFPKKARGKKVFVRFRIATEASVNIYALGWFIDDIGVGRCK
ncbi:M4 family metallopeptidase [Nocardioides jishulii]|uniref:M4 family metallopeptidase n=1 Tax=Nocardioides jishulii TaxID=2575440 RepID=A0A4U2YTZ5_9ACTN|nr:M4 family metallopeptidase [Nocardioides jishulii]QCX28918.1 M4 family metallopeptidase [Nocardioides jishulii]TKI64182.1 M4 family metallopeptidase [Nocardioides jishulii]